MEVDRRMVADHIKIVLDVLRIRHNMHLRNEVFKTNYFRIVNATSERLADIEAFEIWASESGELVDIRGSQ